MKTSTKYFSTFSGAGGFEIALDKLGFECVGLSEIDKYSSAVLRYRYPGVRNYGDITTIRYEQLPDFDLLVGGSPCQDLSVAGKQKGLSGGRSGLFYNYVQILKTKKPKYFIWENVKGALSSNNGWDFAKIQVEFQEAGYDITWQLLNARDFGVPQNRERIFVAGCLRGTGGGKVLRVTAGNAKNIVEITQHVSDSIRTFDPAGIACAQKALGGGLGAKTGLYAVTNSHGVLSQSDTTNCIDANYHKGIDNHGQRTSVLDGINIRRLIPVECERLMSWPDGWTKYGVFDGVTKEISDTQRYKMCGNGVVSAVVYELAKNLL